MLNRREFLNFIGYAGATAGISIPQIGLADFTKTLLKDKKLPDDIILKPGFSYRPILHWGDAIGNGLRFGYNNDYICIQELGPNEIIMMVNHETINPKLMQMRKDELTKEVFNEERKEVGISSVVLKKVKDKWELESNHPLNNRLDAHSEIPFANNKKIAASDKAVGTLANCAGGKTPWGTFLTCEENYEDFIGEKSFEGSFEAKLKYSWEKFWTPAPEHYGWVVEYDPKTKKSQKLTALGRFSHEGALVVQENDHVVVYMGDDRENECLYKFVSKGMNLLEGSLYVANLEKGEWVSLNIRDNKALEKKFKTQDTVSTFTREAAHFVGGTPLARPEDIERDPNSGAIYVALTSDKVNGTPYGALLKIEESEKHSGFKFKSSKFLAGGPQSGFAYPDNLAFDTLGNLWITSDIHEGSLGKDSFTAFPRNGLFYVPMSGKNAGKIELIAWAPPDAEFSGPCFAPDGKLFMSVQHPGSLSKDEKFTSHWPRGGNNYPRPAVVELSGRSLQKLLGKV